MAPEQITLAPVGPAADWYAFGVMLYEALTARLPIDGPSLDLMADKVRRTPPPPSTFVPEVPPDLEALCLDLLQIDPARRPSGADVIERLGGVVPSSEPEGSSETRASIPVLVGRPSELAALEEAWAVCRADRRAVSVFLDGPSGLGKSALLGAFRRRIEADHPAAIVLEGRGFEHETIPYNVFDRVIDGLSRFLRALPQGKAGEMMPRNAWLLPRLFPVLGRVASIQQLGRAAGAELDAQELRARCFGAFRELLARIAERRPLLVILDDVQWAGRDSAMLLAEIVRPPDPPPMLLVLASREASLPDPYAASGDSATRSQALPDDLRRISLGPLPADDARALASHLIARAGDVRLDAAAIAEEAGGHPLFLLELVRYATTGTSRSDRPRLDEAIRARAEAVDPAARDVLDLAVVSGGASRGTCSRRRRGLDSKTFARELAVLGRAHLVRDRERGGGVRPPRSRRDAGGARSRPAARLPRAPRLLRVAASAPQVDRLLLARHLKGAGEDARAADAALLAAEDAGSARSPSTAPRSSYRPRARSRRPGGSRPGGRGAAASEEQREARATRWPSPGCTLEAAAAYEAASDARRPRHRRSTSAGLAARQYVRAGQPRSRNGARADGPRVDRRPIAREPPRRRPPYGLAPLRLAPARAADRGPRGGGAPPRDLAPPRLPPRSLRRPDRRQRRRDRHCGSRPALCSKRSPPGSPGVWRVRSGWRQPGSRPRAAGGARVSSGS